MIDAIRNALDSSKELSEKVTKEPKKKSKKTEVEPLVLEMRKSALNDLKEVTAELKGKKTATDDQVETWFGAVVAAATTAAMLSGARFEGRIFHLCRLLPEAFQALREELSLTARDVAMFSDIAGDELARHFVPYARKAGFEAVGWEQGTRKGKIAVPGSVKPRTFKLSE